MTGRERSARYFDAHTHLAAGSTDLLDLDLRRIETPQDLVARVSAAASRAAPGRWIRGFGWDGAPPPRDGAPGHPVFLARRDGHAAWVNPAGRAALGLDPGTGLVAEAAFDEARRRLPQRSTGERVGALAPRLAELEAHGVDAADDMVEPWAPEVYARLRDAGDLRVSIGMWLPDGLAIDEVEAISRAFPPDDARLAVRGIKIFLDGTLRARTAALSRPYADEPTSRGELRIDARATAERVSAWAERGWPVALHAIGDRAVTLALDALAEAPRPRYGSHRVEHAQVVLRSDLPRFAALGVIASVQPGHWRDDRTWLAERLGERTEVAIHPLASLARSGATLVLGSDWPVSDWDPVGILAAAASAERGAEALRPGDAAAWYTLRSR